LLGCCCNYYYYYYYPTTFGSLNEEPWTESPCLRVFLLPRQPNSLLLLLQMGGCKSRLLQHMLWTTRLLSPALLATF